MPVLWREDPDAIQYLPDVKCPQSGAWNVSEALSFLGSSLGWNSIINPGPVQGFGEIRFMTLGSRLNSTMRANRDTSHLTQLRSYHLIGSAKCHTSPCSKAGGQNIGWATRLCKVKKRTEKISNIPLSTFACIKTKRTNCILSPSPSPFTCGSFIGP